MQVFSLMDSEYTAARTAAREHLLPYWVMDFLWWDVWGSIATTILVFLSTTPAYCHCCFTVKKNWFNISRVSSGVFASFLG